MRLENIIEKIEKSLKINALLSKLVQKSTIKTPESGAFTTQLLPLQRVYFPTHRVLYSNRVLQG